MTDRDITAIVNAVKPGLVLHRTIGKHLDSDKETKKFNEQLEDELNELSKRNMCRRIPGSTNINWMSIPAKNVINMDSYSKYIYYSCRIESMRNAELSSDLILHSLSNDFKFLGSGSFGTISSSDIDSARKGTTDEIVMKSSTDNRSPTDLIHELFIATYLNQLADLGIPNFIMMYGYTSSCNTPFVMEDGNVNTGCERQGPRANILMEKINNVGTFGEFVRNHITGEKKIADTEEESVSIVMELFVQVFAALSVAQKLMQFNHLDLHVGNILIVDMGRKVKTEYQMSDRIFIVRSRYRPIIIDFGMARISINCKLYINRSIDHIEIAKTDLLEGAYIPWYDTHRVLSSMTAYMSYFKPGTNNLMYNMICYLYTLNVFDNPDVKNDGKLPTEVRSGSITIDSVNLINRRNAAISSIEEMKRKGNVLYQSSMADYDLNTPECMVRMMTTDKSVYQFLQSNIVYSGKGTLYNMIKIVEPNFGSTVEMRPQTLIDLKMYVLDRLESSGTEPTSVDGSLGRWKHLIKGSIESFVTKAKNVMNNPVNDFNIHTAIAPKVPYNVLEKFILDVDHIYDHQSMARQIVNYNNEIIKFLSFIDPIFISDEDVVEFNTIGNRLINMVNDFYPKLRIRYYKSLVDLEMSVNNTEFMEIVKDGRIKDQLLSERSQIRNKVYDFKNFSSNTLLRRYYNDTYMKLYVQLLSSHDMYTKPRMLKLGTFIETVVD